MTSSRLKIVLYLYSLGSGGAERVMALLASGLARRGHDVTLVVQVDAAENMPFVSRDVRIARIGAPHGAAVRALARLLASEQPDVSLSALGLCNLKHVLAATRAGRLGHAILSYHGHIDAEPQRTSRLANRLTPITTRLAARTICVSDWMRRHVVDDLHGSTTRCVTIYNPVQIGHAVAAPDANALAQREPLILGLGRFAPAKNFGFLIDAFARLENRNAKLLIVGDGPDRAMLEAKVAALGLSERVEMPGYLTEPWTAFARARACAIPSKSESFSNVAVEALAHGLPVVSTDCGGPREILLQKEEGVLVPVGDVDAFTAALNVALTNPGDPAPRITRAQTFSLDAALDGYEELFSQVAKRAAVPPRT